MHGYAERFHFDKQTVSGWVFDAEARDNRDVRVLAIFDGEIIGEAHPSGSRTDLKRITSQDTTFVLHCSRGFTALDLVSGRLTVTARYKDRESALSLGLHGLNALKRAAVDEINGGITPTLWSRTQRDAVEPQVRAGNLSPVLLPAGLPSQDGSAAIGLRGHLFLTGGTNSLLSQYQAPVDDGLISQVHRWIDLFAQRRELCEARGIGYLQTVIPEKMTVLRDDAPMHIDGPTPLFREVEHRLRDTDYYVSGQEPFEGWDDDDDPFLLTDTHLSPAGAQRVFASLAAQLDPQLVPIIDAVRMDQVRYALGDLTGRFGLPIYSRIIEPSENQISAYSEGLTMVENYYPSTKRFMGRRFRWVNSTAPSELKVLVFGNSFFGTGDFAGYLSWWGKHLFREFHFHWGADIEWSLVDELRPDVVLGQTVERFLSVVPDA